MSDKIPDDPDLRETPGAGDTGGSSILRADIADSDLSDRMAELPDGSLPLPRPAAGGMPTPGGAIPKWQGKRVGRFRIVSLLGRGSWGRVFEAEDTTLRRRIALKLLPTTTRGGMPASDFSRVATEARAAAALEHPNVIQIYEVGEKGDFFFLAMELAEGGSVEEMMKATGPIDAVRACTICAEAGDALSLAHECGILHRDVKPANLLLSRAGRCKVCDFGLASGGETSDPLHATRAAGTAHYVAPEIVKGEEPTVRSDVYSLGVTLYHMLTGRRPFEGTKGRKEVLKAQVNRQPPPLAELAPEVDPKLVKLVERAMSKDPAERFADMRSMSRGLRLFTMPVSASTSGVVVPGLADLPAIAGASEAKPTRRSWMPLAIIAACLVAAGGVAFALMSNGDDDGGTTVDRGSGGPAIAPDDDANAGAATRGGVVSHRFALDTANWENKPDNVAVAGQFNGWNETANPMRDDDGDGMWMADVELSPGVHHYKFVINFGLPDARWIPDPSADPQFNENDGYNNVNSGVMVDPPADDE